MLGWMRLSGQVRFGNGFLARELHGSWIIGNVLFFVHAISPVEKIQRGVLVLRLDH